MYKIIKKNKQTGVMLNKWQIIQHAPSPRAKKMVAAGTTFRNEVRGKAKVKEREREGEQKKEAAWAADGWTVLCKAMVEVNIAYRLCCDFNQWAVVRRPQRSQCEDWGARVRRRFSSYCPADWLQPEFLLRLLHSKNVMESWLLSCWIPKQTYFFKEKTKWDVDLKLMV